LLLLRIIAGRPGVMRGLEVAWWCSGGCTYAQACAGPHV